MTERSSSVTPYRALLFIATVFTIASWLFLVDSNLISQRDKFHESDYIMTFYVAGHLVVSGRSGELYPDASAPSFVDSPFDKAVHRLLPQLPKQYTGAYMHIPLVAGFFAPFSYIDPNWSLLIWQILSVTALALSCRMLSRHVQLNGQEVFFLSSLFLPVFLTLWAGQLGLGFGLLPLCIGFVLVHRQRSFLGGLVWSLLLLKPQFVLAGAFVAVSLALTHRFRVLIGMTVGVTALIVFTILTFGTGPTMQWLLSHRVSDATYSSGLQGIPGHLITGLPANLMILFPVSQRASLKLPLYAAAAAFWIFGLWYCHNLAKALRNPSVALTISFIIAVSLTSLTSPHLLYYDLCVLLPAGVLLLAQNGPLSGEKRLRWIAVGAWIAVSAFFPILIAFAQYKAVPLILELILLTHFCALLSLVNRSLPRLAGNKA